MSDGWTYTDAPGAGGDGWSYSPAPKAKPSGWSQAAIEKALGSQVRVTSTQRNPQQNAKAGGSPTSSHMAGEALDFVPQGDYHEAARKLAAAGIPYDQIIVEPNHVHVGWGPKGRREMLQFDGKRYSPLAEKAAWTYSDAPQKSAPAEGWTYSDAAGDGWSYSDAPAAKPKPKPAAAKPEGPDVLAGFKGAAEDYKKANVGAVRSLQHDFTDPVKGVWGGVKRAAGTAGDLLDNFAGGAPLKGLLTGTVGRATEAASGGKLKREAVGDVAAIAAPFAGEARVPGTAKKLGELATQAFKPELTAAQKAFSPHTVSQEARDAARLHRMVMGTHGVQADIQTHKLAAHAKALGELSDPEKRLFLTYVENRSKGAKLFSPKLQAAADAIRNVATHYRKEIERTLRPSDRPTFIRDYYAHMWQQSPTEVEQAMRRGPSKQGNSRSLRARTMPTYEEGLAAGLTPRFENPVDAMIAYSDNMARYLGSLRIRQGMVKGVDGGPALARWFRPGEAPHGWVQLKGVGTERVPKLRDSGVSPKTEARRAKAEAGLKDMVFSDEPGGPDPMAGRRERSAARPAGARYVNVDRTPQKQMLYAHPDAARIYNNHISQGMSSNPLYRGARAAANGLTQLKLGLSAFHLSVMAREGVVGQMAKGLRELGTSGQRVEGLKTLAKAPAAPVTNALRGHRMFGEIVGDKPVPGSAEAKLNDLYAKSGGRLHMDRIYSVRGAGSFYNSLKRGTFKQDLLSAVKRTYTGSMGDRAKGVVDLAGNMIQSVAGPLFEDYVPMMKRGAWASRMEAFLRERPEASEQEIVTKGQQFLDNVDNRFGELMVDNNFWHKAGFQLSQLLLLSPSWDIGTIREIGGGLADMPNSVVDTLKGKGPSEKTAYVAALAGYTMLENGIMTYVKTGSMPEGMDWFAYRTGGKNPDGSPERAQTASYMKDILALTSGEPGQEVVNKMNQAPKTAYELATNSDWRGDPIYPTRGVGDLGRTVDYAAQTAMPIGIDQVLGGKPSAGSNLSAVERFFGTRPASAYTQNPERYEKGAESRAKRRWAKLKRDERRDEVRKGK